MFRDPRITDTSKDHSVVPWAAAIKKPYGFTGIREVASVAWFHRRKKSESKNDHETGREDMAHLEAFVHSRTGVEGFIEPKTTVTETTLLLVAGDGEWTRRRVASPQTAYQFGSTCALPIYDVALVGYPRRMREYNARMKQRPGHD